MAQYTQSDSLLIMQALTQITGLINKKMDVDASIALRDREMKHREALARLSEEKHEERLITQHELRNAASEYNETKADIDRYTASLKKVGLLDSEHVNMINSKYFTKDGESVIDGLEAFSKDELTTSVNEVDQSLSLIEQYKAADEKNLAVLSGLELMHEDYSEGIVLANEIVKEAKFDFLITEEEMSGSYILENWANEFTDIYEDEDGNPTIGFNAKYHAIMQSIPDVEARGQINKNLMEAKELAIINAEKYFGERLNEKSDMYDAELAAEVSSYFSMVALDQEKEGQDALRTAMNDTIINWQTALPSLDDLIASNEIFAPGTRTDSGVKWMLNDINDIFESARAAGAFKNIDGVKNVQRKVANNIIELVDRGAGHQTTNDALQAAIKAAKNSGDPTQLIEMILLETKFGDHVMKTSHGTPGSSDYIADVSAEIDLYHGPGVGEGAQKHLITLMSLYTDLEGVHDLYSSMEDPSKGIGRIYLQGADTAGFPGLTTTYIKDLAEFTGAQDIEAVTPFDIHERALQIKEEQAAKILSAIDPTRYEAPLSIEEQEFEDFLAIGTTDYMGIDRPAIVSSLDKFEDKLASLDSGVRGTVEDPMVRYGIGGSIRTPAQAYAYAVEKEGFQGTFEEHRVQKANELFAFGEQLNKLDPTAGLRRDEIEMVYNVVNADPDNIQQMVYGILEDRLVTDKVKAIVREIGTAFNKNRLNDALAKLGNLSVTEFKYGHKSGYQAEVIEKVLDDILALSD